VTEAVEKAAPGYYRLHVFCCTNVRPDGHERGSCGKRRAERLRNYLKARAKEEGLTDVRINTAGCLDRCERGPAMVVYPEGVWYHYDSVADVEAILMDHLVGGRPVDRLRLSDRDE
jgi:(2Fe-2S) ferredoxin